MNDIKMMDKKDFRLYIGTAFYEVKAFSPQIVSLKESWKILDTLGIAHTYRQLAGDSYPDRAKNSIVNDFLKTDCTHLMIIDSDETWNPEGFARLIKAALYGCEIVAGLYPCKNNWEFYGGYCKKSEDGFVMGKEFNDMRLIEMEYVPGGFIVYSRDAFERTRPILDYYTDTETKEDILQAFCCNIEFESLKRYFRTELSEIDQESLIDIILSMQSGGRQGMRIGEDIYFQKRYREMGGQIWCEPNIEMGHYGIKEWRGNYQTFLLNEKIKAEIERATGDTQDKTEEMLRNISKNIAALKNPETINNLKQKLAQ